MVANAGAGPSPIPYKALRVQNLAEAIQYCLTEEALHSATNIASKMRTESGVQTAVDSFHRGLPQELLKCDILEGQSAVWTYKRGRRQIKLSRVAAQILSEHLKLDLKKLE